MFKKARNLYQVETYAQNAGKFEHRFWGVRWIWQTASAKSDYTYNFFAVGFPDNPAFTSFAKNFVNGLIF